MAYDPVDPLDLRNGLLGTATPYSGLWTAHNEVYAADAPSIVEFPFFESLPDNVTAQRVFVFRIRGNYDAHPITVRVYAESTAGTSTIIATIAGVSDSESITAAGWYTMSITPVVTGIVACEIAITVPIGATLSLTRVQAYTVPPTPAAGVRPSRFTRGDSAIIYTADEPVASEHVTRLLGGPVRLAQTAPRCVAHHVVRTTLAGGAKSIGNWQAYDTSAWTLCGMMRIPRVSTRVRPYVLDVFTTGTDAAAGRAEITIGGIPWRLDELGGSAGMWHELELELGAGPHDVRVSALPNASSYVRVPTFQAWRGRRSYP